MPISGGAGGDIDFSVRITADNQVFVNGVRASNEEVKKLGEGIKQVGKESRETAREQESLSGAVFKGATAADLAMKAGEKLVQVYAQMRDETRQAQQETLRLESVLRATHEASGRTAAQITELANAMAKVTRFDDDAVKRAAAQVASFGDITGATFDRTIRLAGDMSAVFGGDLTANATRLAKALTEPGESLGALERLFGRFDPEVKRAIANALELNDAMLAQQTILDAVAGRVEGAATNSYRGLELQVEGTRKAYNDLLKAIGGQLFEAKSQEASTFERVIRATTAAIDDNRSAIEKWKSAMKGFFLGGGPIGMLFQSAGDSEEARARESLSADAPKAAGGGDPNRQRVDSEFQRLLDGSKSKAQRFQQEWDHAILTIRQKGMEGTAEAAQILAAITAKYAEAPKKIADHSAKALRELVKAAEEASKAETTRYNNLEGTLDALRAITAAAAEEVELLGVSREEAALIRKEREITARIEKDIAEQQRRGLPYTEEQQKILREQGQLAIEQLRTTRDQTAEYARQVEEARLLAAEQRAADQQRASVWGDFSNRVASVAAGLSRWRDELRAFVRELIAIVAKKWVLNLVAAATGSSAVGAQAAQTGVNSFAGTAVSWGGEALATGLGYSAMGGFGELAAGYTAQAAYLAGTAETAAVAGTLAGEIGAAIAAIPVWGWIVAAIAAVAVAIGSRGGGPKVGGSFNGAFDAQGNFIGDVAVAGSDNGRFFTPNQADSVVSKLGRQTAAGYYQMLDRFHGSSAGVQFGLGFDQDPQGTAGARISSSVVIGGQRVFGSQDRGVDKDPEQFNAELALESKRMILAALQASDLPEAVAAIIGAASAATATSDQIDQLIQLAEAFTVLSDSLGDFDPDKIIATASRTSKEVFADQGKALAELASKSTLTTASLQTLTAATAQYKDMAAQLILGLEQAKRSIDEMFGQTSRNIRLAGLDDQGKYNFYQSEAERLFAQIGTSTSAEEVERLSARINENINAAFALLSPEQQRSMGDEYLKRIDNTNKVIQDRLTKLQTEAAATTKKQLDDIKAVIDKLALDQKAAADTQKQAADTQLVAANTPQRVDVNVNLSGGSPVVNGG